MVVKVMYKAKRHAGYVVDYYFLLTGTAMALTQLEKRKKTVWCNCAY